MVDDMQLETISEDEFFTGLNQRITELSKEIEGTAQNIAENPDSSTYHFDNFFHPLRVMRMLQRIRDKARAFKEHEDEDVVYVKKSGEDTDTRYYYLPQSEFDRSRLPELIRRLERTEHSEELGYIS